ncbi:MAG: hypothetical protein COV79_02485 [Parcubacteria group bacterium CG11_big_fil_rev_8_21_14_0_20_41_14]|nr:MAG: hypothetical protein COV79_02485 [Parcubacteria group bacterium CG11_big_fil_rev_8_21_14_0_20_41_14]PIX57423.1 MAG: hypothetical protein COZ48_00755 [Candidatus Yonathbacteria bacterium CG_4_10_14_3_um_filter_43_12]
MNIIDTNGIQHIFANNLTPQEDYYLVPDVEEEVEMTQLIHGRRLPATIFEIGQSGDFNEAVYLRHYKNILNKYGGRSFYNMTGFGDVSILAALLMLMEVFENRVQTQLFQNSERVTVYTSDARLTTRIGQELAGKDVEVRPVTGIS